MHSEMKGRGFPDEETLDAIIARKRGRNNPKKSGSKKRSPFFYFLCEVRDKINTESGDMEAKKSLDDVRDIAGEQWEVMEAEEKRDYFERARKSKARLKNHGSTSKNEEEKPEKTESHQSDSAKIDTVQSESAKDQSDSAKIETGQSEPVKDQSNSAKIETGQSESVKDKCSTRLKNSDESKHAKAYECQAGASGASGASGVTNTANNFSSKSTKTSTIPGPADASGVTKPEVANANNLSSNTPQTSTSLGESVKQRQPFRKGKVSQNDSIACDNITSKSTEQPVRSGRPQPKRHNARNKEMVSATSWDRPIRSGQRNNKNACKIDESSTTNAPNQLALEMKSETLDVDKETILALNKKDLVPNPDLSLDVKNVNKDKALEMKTETLDVDKETILELNKNKKDLVPNPDSSLYVKNVTANKDKALEMKTETLNVDKETILELNKKDLVPNPDSSLDVKNANMDKALEMKTETLDQSSSDQKKMKRSKRKERLRKLLEEFQSFINSELNEE